MVNVVFVAPFLMTATLRFIKGVAELSGVRLALVTQDHPDKVPPELDENIAHCFQVEDCLHPHRIHEAIKAVENRMGTIDRLLGTLEQIQVPLAEVRQMLGIEGMGPDTAHNFRDKSHMKTLLRENNIPCARHCLASSAKVALSFAQRVGFPLVLKPPAGSGSRNTHQVRDKQSLETFLAGYHVSPQQPLLLEAFIRGDEYTFESVHIKGTRVWHGITRYFPSPLEVLENPWIQWCIVLPRETEHPFFDDIRDLADQSLKVLGMQTGLSHLEWFRETDGRIAISEVAARPPGGQLASLHGFAHDMDIFSAWAELMVFERFDPPPRQYAAGAAFLRGQGRGRVWRIEGLEEVKKALSPMIVEMKLPRLGQPSSGTYEGEGYILVRHQETSVVEKALDLIINHVRIRLS